MLTNVKLIVSCQSEDNDPFNSPLGVSLFAKAAEMGGAECIRSEGISKTSKIISSVNIPVIGLVKSRFEDGSVKITGSFNDVEELIKVGCKIIAIDGTNRKRESLTGYKFIEIIKKTFNCFVVADISNCEDALLCQSAGADYIFTTLNGYTPETLNDNNGYPNYRLIKELLKNGINIPVYAEGRISTPYQAKKLINLGASGVVVGTFITRPRIITSIYSKKIKK